MGYLLTIIATFFDNLMGGLAMYNIMSLAGIIFLGVPTVTKISSYALAIAEQNGIGPEYAVLIAIVVSLLCSLFFAWLFTRVSFDSFVVLSLASVVASQAFINSWDTVTNGVLGISGTPRPVLIEQFPNLVIAYGFFVLLFLVLEWIILKTWIGRAMRAYREDPIALESIGINTIRFAQAMIIVWTTILSCSYFFFLWRVQFLDASDMLPSLITLITLAIIANKPKLRFVILGAAFVTFLPEILRFFNFPSSILGYLRLLIYALLLMILLYKLSSHYIVSHRTV